MRSCLVILIPVLFIGCGGDVFIGGTELIPPDTPTSNPPSENPPETPTPPGSTCGASETIVTVTGTGCVVGGEGVVNVDGVEPAPSIDGVGIRADDCFIRVAGVGADLAEVLSIGGQSVFVRVAPNWIELYPLAACDPCSTCECPQRLPILFAADGLLDGPEDVPRPVRVTRGATTCTEALEGGCSVEGYELTMSTFILEANVELGTPPVQLGTVSAPEGDTIVDESSGVFLRNLRSHGLSPECLAQVDGEAAWVAYRPIAPSL